MKFYKTASFVQMFIGSALFFGNIGVAFPAMSLLSFFVLIMLFAGLVVFAVININKLAKVNYGQISKEMVMRASIPSIVIFSMFVVCFIIGGAIALF